MTANETYRILRAIVGPWFRASGFKLARSYLTYQKRVGDRYLTVRFQCHHQGWEKHRGSSFTVFVQATDDENVDQLNLTPLTRYLGFEQLEFIRARQNRILASIPQPPPEHVRTLIAAFEKAFRDPKPIIDLYLKDWEPVTQPYNASDPVWFRYFTQDDVKSWALLLLKHVERACADAAHAAARSGH